MCQLVSLDKGASGGSSNPCDGLDAGTTYAVVQVSEGDMSNRREVGRGGPSQDKDRNGSRTRVNGRRDGSLSSRPLSLMPLCACSLCVLAWESGGGGHLHRHTG